MTKPRAEEAMSPTCGHRCPTKGGTCFPGPCALFEARREAGSRFAVGKSMPPACEDCGAIPRDGFCNLNGCPTAPPSNQRLAIIARLAMALRQVREFVEAEVENRGAAGSEMTDYQDEARLALEAINAALEGLA